jgi:Cu-Zn family superoxide dismutase
MPRSVLIVAGMLYLAALPLAQAPASKPRSSSLESGSAQAEIKDATGQVVGRATLTETSDGVRIQTTFAGLPVGVHGFHIHDVGQCDPPFTTAGGHFNPEPKQHGRENRMGRHAGDLPNLTVPENGRVIVEVVEPMVSLRSGPNGLMDSDGSALVVHERRDDNRTDPDGHAGSRIACGVITK